MTRLLLAITLLLPVAAQAAGLGVYNPAQHAVNGFMPTQLPGLQLWLDANKIGLTNGASVDVWQDFSGKSNWATNGAASKQPTVNNSVMNGRNSVFFDGVDDGLVITNYVDSGTISLFCVLYQPTNSSYFFVELSSDSNAKDGFYIYGDIGFTANFKRGPNNQTINLSTLWLSTNKSVVSYNRQTNWVIERNGKELTGTNIGTVSASYTTNTLFIASRALSSVFSRVYISELAVFTNNLIQENSKSLTRYLGTKYGIVVQ